MTSFHDYRAKVTGYSPAPNRYFVRLTAPVGKVPTTNWSDKKGIITGYTAPSDQYFATRARMAYHPADKTFGSFSGNYLTIEGATNATTANNTSSSSGRDSKTKRHTTQREQNQTPQTQSSGNK